MNIPALLLITLSCTWSLVYSLYLSPDTVVLQDIDGTLYEFGPKVPLSGDWLAFYPYQRYPSTKHRSKRQTEWGVRGSVSIPLGGGSSKPSWKLGGFVTRSDPVFNSRLEGGLGGKFGDTPSWSLRGQLERTGTNSHFTGKGQIGGQFGNTPDWSLGGLFSRREGDWTGRLGGGLNSQGGSTIGVGLERGGLGAHIDATNGKLSVGPGSIPNTDPSEGYTSNYP
ncbi:hypothetical protein CHS0354_010690 [Potamilus streckersoni]|uniref:Secreted protein n=1 Tax=Potamilus streckersoni TaxID=2493646 RepID=A0AAE0TCY6_9BIVA|nr:hypothetical protein CHS0354_010690 [Potamilus streckersoni]